MKPCKSLFFLFVLFFGLIACGPDESAPFPIPDEDYAQLGLSDTEIASLLSLEQVDDYPLYTMEYFADYQMSASPTPLRFAHPQVEQNASWACSLFAALADPESRLYGRNFDWEFSPAILLYTDPPVGYASVSMVDIAYLGFAGDRSEDLTAKTLPELIGLLEAPYLPFDGLNEAGLAIGMAAVPAGNVPADPGKTTLGSLGVIRVVLDQAASVDEALEIMQRYNIDFEGGPPVHYLIADARGQAALVEHYQGEIHILRNQTDWHQATNFLNSSVDSSAGQCWRYDAISEQLEANQGVLNFASALDLLGEVSQASTQWSVVYSMSTGEIRVAMGRDYEQVHILQLEMSTR